MSTHPPIGQQPAPPEKKQPAPEVWRPVDGKRYLEQNQRGQLRTKPTGAA